MTFRNFFWSRRAVAASVVLVLISLFLFLSMHFTLPTAGPTNPIVAENQRPGTDQWRIPNGSGSHGFLSFHTVLQDAERWTSPNAVGLIVSDKNNQIKGYSSASSVNVGNSLTFYVTVSPEQPFSIDIYRMGWYGGKGGRLMLHEPSLKGITQPTCPVVDSSTSLMVCNWKPSYNLSVPATWTDGTYLAVITNAQKYQNYIPFVVRNDRRKADILVLLGYNTYQAYNDWGGKSLYSFNSTNGARAYKVSFDRPYGGNGAGDFLGWDIYTVQWLEKTGYNVTYMTDADVEANPRRLLAFKAVISSGHDEYWTRGMYDAVQTARDSGVNIAFFGANAVYWQARYEAASTGATNRVLVCYKTSENPHPIDPITERNPALTTDLWRNSQPNRPEQQLVGVMFTSQTGRHWDSTVDWVPTSTSSWAFTGTKFGHGSSVARITGYEVDRSWSTYPLPKNQSYTVLASSPFVNTTGAHDTSNSVIYQSPSGAWVFAAGTMAWSWGLQRPGYLNSRIQKITSNVLDRFVGTH